MPRIAKTLYAHTLASIVGNVRFAGNGLDQFRDAGRYAILHAKDLTSGDVKSPYRPA